MYLSTRDMARFGVLMLSRGSWGGQAAFGRWLPRLEHELGHPFRRHHPHRNACSRNVDPLGLWSSLMGMGCAPAYPGNTYAGPYEGAYSAMGSGGQFITVFPMMDLVVVHKVDIDADYAANISALGYDAALEMVLDARCDVISCE